LLILDIPNLLIGPAGDIRDELADLPVWISAGQFHDGRQKLGALFVIHGNRQASGAA
jgi:hypothetical protein